MLRLSKRFLLLCGNNCFLTPTGPSHERNLYRVFSVSHLPPSHGELIISGERRGLGGPLMASDNTLVVYSLLPDFETERERPNKKAQGLFQAAPSETAK